MDAAHDVPGEAGVLQRPLGKDERLAGDVGYDDSRGGERCRRTLGHGGQPLRGADREGRAREQ